MTDIWILPGLAKSGSTHLIHALRKVGKQVELVTGDSRGKLWSKHLFNLVHEIQTQFNEGQFDPEKSQKELEVKIKLIRQLKRHEPASADTLIISWPSLSGSFGGAKDGFRSVSTISEILSRIVPNAKVLLCLRRQDGYLKSLFNTYARRGGVRDFTSFISGDGYSCSLIRTSIDPYDCDWLALGSAWSKNFETKYIFYEELRDSPNIFYRRVSELLGLTISPLDTVNRSIDNRSIKKILVINKLFSELRKIFSRLSNLAMIHIGVNLRPYLKKLDCSLSLQKLIWKKLESQSGVERHRLCTHELLTEELVEYYRTQNSLLLDRLDVPDSIKAYYAFPDKEI